MLFREFRKIQHKEYLKYKYEATEKILKKKYEATNINVLLKIPTRKNSINSESLNKKHAEKISQAKTQLLSIERK